MAATESTGAGLALTTVFLVATTGQPAPNDMTEGAEAYLNYLLNSELEPLKTGSRLATQADSENAQLSEAGRAHRSVYRSLADCQEE